MKPDFQNRRDFLKAAALSMAAASVPGYTKSPRSSRSSGDKPNLLFIMTDQQRWDTLSIAGNPIVQTPNLDRLARQGVYFERAYTQCAVCGPARTSILTGCAVETHRVLTNGHTAGHQSVLIQSEDRTAIYFGDLVPTTSHLKIPYIMGYDLFPLDIIEKKKEVLEKAMKQQWLLIFEHDPKNPFGYLKEVERKPVFQPI